MTVYLIRHADAGRRDPFSPGDHLRELSADGWRQARRIAERLGDSSINRVLTSPYPRCVQTVEPLADRLGLTVEHHKALAEGGDGRVVLGLMRAMAGAGAALCSHGDVIPDVIRVLGAMGARIDSRRNSAKGSVWTVTFDGDRPVAATYAKTPRSQDAAVG